MIEKVIDSFASGYAAASLNFGMVRKIDEETAETVICMKPCRDGLHDIIRCQIHGGSDWYTGYNSTKHKPVDLDAFRLLLDTTYNEARFNYMLKCFHILEEKMDIENPMTYGKVVVNGGKEMYLLEGDKFWISDPHLMSLVSLVVRWVLLRARDFPKLENMDYEHMVKWWKTGAKGSLESDVRYYMPSVLTKIHIISEHAKKIFSLPIEDAYPNFKRFSRDQFHAKGGIHELCDYNSEMPELENTMKELERDLK